MFKKIMYLFGSTINCAYYYKKICVVSVTKFDMYFNYNYIGQMSIIVFYRFY